ncbi:hypothetical protein ACFORO_25800 [Amycolatopsis halotolerans]|uniref:Uncharacterized protein n=1 Tax=Amycolatopsis halotolerans TaxID=330083 RepID=A0ABV7QNV5_9PSEU
MVALVCAAGLRQLKERAVPNSTDPNPQTEMTTAEYRELLTLVFGRAEDEEAAR